MKTEKGARKVFIKITAPAFWELWGENENGLVTDVYFSEKEAVKEVIELEIKNCSDFRIVLKSNGINHVFSPD